MDITLDHIVALALGRSNVADAAAIRAAMDRSTELQAAFDRFALVAQTVSADARDAAPASAIDAAKGLGRRLEALRSPSLGERIDGAIRSIMARLVFDSRLDGPIVGLRGGTGFVISYEVEAPTGRADIDLECVPADLASGVASGIVEAGDAFDLVGMANGIAGGSLIAVADEGRGQRFETGIDDHGMFRIRLAAGTYRLQLNPGRASAASIELPTLELP